MSETRSERTAVTVIERPPVAPVNNRACLVVIYGAELGKRYALEPPTRANPAGQISPRLINVGRSGSCEVMLDEESVSRKHAQFQVHADGRVLASDAGSTNGTYVNDRAVKVPTELRDGDFVKIGRTIFKYLTSQNIEAQYNEEIYRLTTTDGLTSIYNKRYFVEALEREMGRCQRYKRPLSLMMIDIDHFKKINDSYGHLAGDHVLKLVAQAMSGSVRKEDVLARYGGEEFGLILPEIELEGACQLGEKLRSLVQSAQVEWEGKPIQVTVSIGVSELSEAMKQTDDFVERSDQCLYKAKQSGRNRVCSN